MDIFKTFEGNQVDLDDMSIFPEEWKGMTTYQLWDRGWTEAGRSIFYMKYIWPDSDDGTQWFQVDKLCSELMVLWKVVGEDSEKNRHIFMKWLYHFRNEVENQC